MSDSSVLNTSDSAQQHQSTRNFHKQTIETPDFFIEKTSLGPLHPKKAFFLHIPGNPGLNAFYTPYMRLLMDNLLQSGTFSEKDVQIASISLAGHWTQQPSKSGMHHYTHTYTLDDQVAYFVGILREFYLPNPDLDIYLSGHSIGGYICTQVVHSLTPEEQERIKRVFLLCPTVMGLGDSPNGQRFYMRTLAFNRFFARSAVEWFFHYWNKLLPFWVRLKVFNVVHGSTEHLDPHIESLHSAYILGNALKLTATEYMQVTLLQKEIYEALPHRFVFLFSSCDEWVPMKYVEHIRAELKEHQSAMEVLDVKHAFCIYPNNNELIASTVAKYVMEGL